MKPTTTDETLVPIWVKPSTKSLFVKKVARATLDRGIKVTFDTLLKELVTKK